MHPKTIVRSINMQISKVFAAVACASALMGAKAMAGENPNTGYARMATELKALQEQMIQMQTLYEARITSLEQKLANTARTPKETGQSPEATSTGPAAEQATPQPIPQGSTQTAAAAAGAPSAFNPEISLILQGAYAHRKNIEDRRIGRFMGNLSHSHNGNGHQYGSDDKRGFNIGHTELVFGANIDPYWRGQVMLSAINEEVEVEEAWIQTTALGHGTKIKAGRFLSGIGYMNEQHAHEWDFYEQPLMYRALFGSHSYGQDGLQLKWVAPLDTFVEFGAEIGRGQQFPGTDRNINGPNSYALFGHIGADIGVSGSWRAGLSWLRTKASEREFTTPGGHHGHGDDGSFSGQSQMWIADFVYKWAPKGNPARQSFKLQGEYFIRTEKGDMTIDDHGTKEYGQWNSRQSGFYLAGVYKFTPNWRAGLRYDRLNSGRQNAIGLDDFTPEDYRPNRLTAMIDYSWSEYSRMRLQWARDRAMPMVTDNQVTLQYIMSLGSHGAHRF